jgi:hypothetical protein
MFLGTSQPRLAKSPLNKGLRGRLPDYVKLDYPTTPSVNNEIGSLTLSGAI